MARFAKRVVTRGGLNTKIHALCDALGNPVRLVLTAGQRHDSKVPVELLKDAPAKAIVADNAYDSNEIAEHAQENGMEMGSSLPKQIASSRAPWAKIATKHGTWLKASFRE